jgi:hypothetical protein
MSKKNSVPNAAYQILLNLDLNTLQFLPSLAGRKEKLKFTNAVHANINGIMPTCLVCSPEK